MKLGARITQTSCTAGVTAQPRACLHLGMCAEEAEAPGCTPGIDKLFSYRVTRSTRLCGDNSSPLLSQDVGLIRPLACDDKAAGSTWSKKEVGNVRSSTQVPRDLAGASVTAHKDGEMLLAT